MEHSIADVMRAIGNLEGKVDGINARLDKVNGQIGKQWDRLGALEKVNDQEEGRRGAFDWLGSFTAGGIGLVMGIVGSFIQAGKIF